MKCVWFLSYSLVWRCRGRVKVTLGGNWRGTWPVRHVYFLWQDWICPFCTCLPGFFLSLFFSRRPHFHMFLSVTLPFLPLLFLLLSLCLCLRLSVSVSVCLSACLSVCLPYPSLISALPFPLRLRLFLSPPPPPPHPASLFPSSLSTPLSSTLSLDRLSIFQRSPQIRTLLQVGRADRGCRV